MKPHRRGTSHTFVLTPTYCFAAAPKSTPMLKLSRTLKPATHQSTAHDSKAVKHTPNYPTPVAQDHQPVRDSPIYTQYGSACPQVCGTPYDMLTEPIHAPHAGRTSPCTVIGVE